MKLTDAILGFVVADAMGVPVEFMTREQLDADPVVDMRGFGTYNQPPGTWSDDSSMTLATLDGLNKANGKPNSRIIFNNFKAWLNDFEFTPHGYVFDIGNTTKRAIRQEIGQGLESDNGNGALMRMLPLAFLPLPIDLKLHYARGLAALTHSHELNLITCEFYVKVADNLINGVDDWLRSAFSLIQFYGDPNGAFSRIPNIGRLPRKEIRSTCYVIDTLEAALWCLETTRSYRDCVLTAVNLGDDTDTIAACAGGLAGIVYGEQSIPAEWLSQIARLDWVRGLCEAAEKWFKM